MSGANTFRCLFRIYREVTPWDAVNGMRRDLQKARADAEDMRQALQHGKGGVSKESARLARELAYQYQVGLAHAVAEAGKLWSLAEALSPPALKELGPPPALDGDLYEPKERAERVAKALAVFLQEGGGGTVEPALPPPATPADDIKPGKNGSRSKGKKTANQLLQDLYNKRAESVSWTAEECGSVIHRAASTIVDTPTWKANVAARFASRLARKERQKKAARPPDDD